MNLQTASNQIDWLAILTYPATAISGGLVGGLILFVIQNFLKKGISHEFDKSMQDIKQNHAKRLADIGYEYNKQLSLFNAAIAKEVDKETRDFQRKIHDFSLYSTKRHEIYPELFGKLYKFKYDTDLFESKAYLVMDMVKSKEHLLLYLKELGVTVNEIFMNQINDIYEEYYKSNDLNKCFEDFNQIFRLHLTAHMSKEYQDLYKFYHSNILYLSDNVACKVDVLIVGMHNLISAKTKIEPSSDMDIPLLTTTVSIALDELKTAMREEISIGDYSYVDEA
ncbi:hypothetical protein [Priestia aryabhattai]|uniref:hypothetical protein n=1 Tax=Priestia aryabhattai TaxID=412384 RepID=UPI001C8E1FAC|nr:hypothetical protein [Priestia aryabhattai]MBX9998171.1 hypothetical protein [Priestia aryabhattai]